MKIGYARARVRRWLRPTLEVPVALAPRAGPTPLILGELRGYRRDGVLVIVTPRGVEMPIDPLSDWLVMDVVRYVAQVERAPEAVPGSFRV